MTANVRFIINRIDSVPLSTRENRLIRWANFIDNGYTHIPGLPINRPTAAVAMDTDGMR